MRCKRSRCNSSFYSRINDQRQGCPDRKSVTVFIYPVRGTNCGWAVRTFLIKGIIPHMEREGYKLAEIIQNRKALHRSLFSATRKLFGSGNSKSGQLSGGFSNWRRLDVATSQSNWSAYENARYVICSSINLKIIFRKIFGICWYTNQKTGRFTVFNATGTIKITFYGGIIK